MIELIIQTKVMPAFRTLLMQEAVQRGQFPGEVKMEFYINDEQQVCCKLTDKEGRLVRAVTQEEFAAMFK